MNPTKRLRIEADLTQREAAALAGVSQPLWWKWENNLELLNLRHKTQLRISEALGTNIVGLHIERRNDRIDAALGED